MLQKGQGAIGLPEVRLRCQANSQHQFQEKKKLQENDLINVLRALRGLMSLVIIRTVIYHTGGLSDLLLPWQTVTHGAFKNIVLFIQRDLLQLDRKEGLRYHKIWFKSQTPTALPDLWRAQYSTCTLWSTCIWAWYQWVLFLYLGYFTYWYQSGKKGSNVGKWSNTRGKWTKCLLMRIQRHSGKLNTRGQGLNNQGTHQESHWGTRSKTKKKNLTTGEQISK